VQDAHDVNVALGHHPIKQDVRPGGELSIAGADLFTRSAN